MSKILKHVKKFKPKKNPKDPRSLMGIIFILLVGVVGVILLIGLQAQSPYVSIEAESGSITSPATTKSDSNASGGKFVQFGSNSVTKPKLTGLIDRQGLPSPTYQSTIQAYVVNANWSDLQPSQGDPITSNNVIDQAITQVDQLNAANPGLHMVLKLRIYAGINAPDWAKNIGGAPFTMTDDHGSMPVSGTVGRFWTSGYESAWNDFESELAAKYDNAPEVVEVDSDRCSTVYNEPLLRQADSPSSIANLLGAGYTYQADEQCQYQEINELKAVWRHTNVDISFNPYDQVNPDGTVTTNEDFTDTLMNYFRNKLGTQGVLENDSINTSRTGSSGDYPTMYSQIKALGPPITYQTSTLSKIGDLGSTLQWAISQGANAVELPAGYDTIFTPTQLEPYNQQLNANPTK